MSMSAERHGQVNVIPRPVRVSLSGTAPFALQPRMAVHALGGNEAQAVAQHLVAGIKRLTGMQLAGVDGREGDGVVLKLDAGMKNDGGELSQREGYRLSVNERRVEIAARTGHGLFNGVQTLAQLAQSAGGSAWSVPAGVVEDWPRFAWRGLQLDVGRHFFSVEEILRLLDLMALHKLNTFHMHLTEDQGWRVEVKRYPKLTEVGAWRAESPKMGDRKSGDGIPYGGFYTQEDLKRIVAYAGERFITVVPEIEMPGHSTAAIAAYPELGNQDVPGLTVSAVSPHWSVHENTLNPTAKTFEFIGHVFDELLPLFPGEYVHIGGDEAPKTQWQKSAVAQDVMQSNGLKDEHELQAWFVRRVEEMLHARGKRLIGWDEIQEGGLSPTATMMVWRDWKWARHALDRGNQVVMAPTSHLYFDYGQENTPAKPEFEVIGASLTTQKVYELEPVPDGVSAEQAKNVLGCEAQLWGEYIWSWDKLTYMTFPRACAMAEVAWTTGERKWEDFSGRLSKHMDRLDRLGVNYRRDDGMPARGDVGMGRTPRVR